MGKEIQSYKKATRDVLREQCDPLFNDKMGRKKPLVLMAALRACFLISAVVLCVILWKMVNTDKTADLGGEQPPPLSNIDVESGDRTEISDTSEQTEADYESDLQESTEMESDAYEGESQDGKYNEEYIEGIDISALEMGEAYIVNETDKNVDVDKLLEEGVSYKISDEKRTPIVLIMHTHTCEEYVGFDEKAKGLKTVVSVGEALCTRLNSLGVPAVHCTVIHDGDKKASAYSGARKTLETMLEIYPSVRCIIDVHRMSITDDKGNPAKTLAYSPVPTAQIRMTVSGFESQKRDWIDSLSLALAIRKELNLGGEGICAPVCLSENRYNSDMCALYIMADVGTEGNSVSEAARAGERLADAIAESLYPQKK